MNYASWTLLLLLLGSLTAALRAQPMFDAPQVWDDGRRIVAAGDLNGDLRPDLVSIFAASNNFVVGLNDGQGAFNDLAAVSNSDLSDSQFGIGDVNGDGQNDLIMASATTAQLTVWPGLGTGLFGTSSSTSLGGSAAKLFVGQANGDSSADVLLHINVAGTWQLQWLLGGPAGLSLGAPFLTQAGTAGLDFSVIDLQADGLTDLATFDAVNGSQLRTFVTNSGGVLVNGPAFPTPSTFLAGTQVVAGDFDANGTTDLALALPEPGGPGLPFGSELRTLIFANSGLGNLAPQAEQVSSMQANIAGQVFAGDWDNDGDADLIHYTGTIPGTGLVFPPGIELFSNSGAGVFTQQWLVPYFAPFIAGVGMQDLNGDSRSDVITSNSVTLSSPSGSSPTAESYLNWQGRLVDADGDGDVDLMNDGLLSFTVNDGQGLAQDDFALVQALPTLPANEEYRSPFVRDLDGDGDLDAVVEHATLTPFPVPGFPPISTFVANRTLINNQSGVFQDIGVSVLSGGPRIPLSVGNVEWFQSPILADFDQDGLPDILAYDELWLGQSIGVFAEAPGSYWSGWVPLDVGDVDGDGDLDVLASLQNSIQSLVTVHINNGSGGFFPIDLPGASPNDKAAAFGDIDDDGDLDVVVVGPFTIYENTGAGFSLNTFSTPFSFLPQRVAFEDLNGDGLTDLFFSNDNSRMNTVRVLLRNGPGLSFAPFQSYMATATMGVADLDGDGDLDIVGRSQSLNRRFEAPTAGSRRQYGPATPGTNGVSPLFGVEGPMRIGETLTFRVRGVVGAASGVLAFGNQESNLPDFPFFGSTALNFPWATILTLPTAPGTPSVMGEGAFSFQAFMPPSLLGVRVFLQCAFTDVNAPSGVAFSNGLDLLIGQ